MALVFYTDKFIPKGFAAVTRGPVIFIRPSYKGDTGLLEHEKTHQWQWVRTLSLHSWMYLLSKRYRLKSEVEAYRRQARWHYDYDEKLELFAKFISEKYGLNITQEEALRRLKDQ